MKYPDEGEIWFRKKGKSLNNCRIRILTDTDIPDFLQAPKKDGFDHLYVVHNREKNKVVDDKSEHVESDDIDLSALWDEYLNRERGD